MVRKLANSHHAPADWQWHAQMVLESWAGKAPNEIAAELDCHAQTVRIHLARFNADGVDGLVASVPPQCPGWTELCQPRRD
jgi:predicted ArsR family transcriptional regulator